MNEKKVVSIIFAGMVLLSACGDKKEIKEAKKKFCLSDTMKHMITIDTVQLCNVTDEVKLSGEVGFDENKIVKVFPNSSGQVTEVKVSLGDKVSQGDVLAVIKSADVAGNYSDLAGAEADLAISKRQLSNAETLYQRGISSEREYEEAKQNYEKSLAVRDKIASLISINGGGNTKPGGLYYIKSPISGYIVEKKINSGNFIRLDMGDNLFTISNLKDVWIYANVFESDIPKVKQGFNAKITTLAYPDKVFNGQIDKVSQVLDPTNKALKVRIRMPNEDLLLKPEMFTNVIITNTEAAKAACIPSGSVIEEGGKTYVIIYNNDCDLSVQQIEVLKIVGDKTFLKSGITAGQKLITHNALMLYDEFTDNN